MSVCTQVKRRRCRDAKTNLERIQYVSDAWVEPPGTGNHQGWTIEAVLLHHEAPAAVLSAIAAAELRLDPDATGTRGEPPETRVVARA